MIEYKEVKKEEIESREEKYVCQKIIILMMSPFLKKIKKWWMKMIIIMIMN
jgi:hypothetical protein